MWNQDLLLVDNSIDESSQEFQDLKNDVLVELSDLVATKLIANYNGDLGNLHNLIYSNWNRGTLGMLFANINPNVSGQSWIGNSVSQIQQIISLKDDIKGWSNAQQTDKFLYQEDLKSKIHEFLTDTLIQGENKRKNRTDSLKDKMKDIELLNNDFITLLNAVKTNNTAGLANLRDELKWVVKEEDSIPETEVEVDEVEDVDNEKINDEVEIDEVEKVKEKIIPTGPFEFDQTTFDALPRYREKFFYLHGITDFDNIVNNIEAQNIIEKNLETVYFLWVKLKVHKAIAAKLKRVAKRIEQKIDANELKKYTLLVKQCFGYNRRNVRNSDSLSNHALGLAVDFNSISNRIESSAPDGITKKNIRTKIWDYYKVKKTWKSQPWLNIPKEFVNAMEEEGFRRWGYRVDPFDPMHFELSPAQNMDYLVEYCNDPANGVVKYG